MRDTHGKIALFGDKKTEYKRLKLMEMPHWEDHFEWDCDVKLIYLLFRCEREEECVGKN
jgi:hypothetical protein